MKPLPSRSPPVFVCSSFEAGTGVAEINGNEARHAMRARRLRIDDAVCLTNGRGLMADGWITSVDPRGSAFSVELRSTTMTPCRHPQQVLASALPKGERQSTMLDMATQLGMDRLIPLDCEHSVVRYHDKMLPRWQRIVESACKQSRRSWFPGIETARDPVSLLDNLAADTLILYGDHNAKGKSNIEQLIAVGTRSIVLMVGPEAGFSAAEQGRLDDHKNAHGVAIGKHVLRTETAATALLAICGNLYGNL